MKKYKLMVVDDELIAVEAIKFIVDKEIDNIEVIETAKSGRDAIEKVMGVRPDIMIMDIRMPGINGLECINEIQKIYKNIKFIIISAYEYFDFAKQAVELGVNEYITKPVNKVHLIETLKKITDSLEDEKKRIEHDLVIKEKMDKMITVVEHSFVYSLILNQGEEIDVKKYKKLFELSGGYGYILTIKCVENDALKMSTNFHNELFYDAFKSEMKCLCKCIIGPVMMDRVVVYVSESPKDEYNQRVEIISMLEKVVQKLKSKFDISLICGVGSIKKDSYLILSYQESLKAIDYSNHQVINHIDDISIGVERSGLELLNDVQKIIKALEHGDSCSSINILGDIFYKYTGYYANKNLKNRLIEMIVAAHRIAIENGISSDDCLDYDKYLSEILEVESQSEFEKICINKISYIATKIKISKESTVNAIVDKANDLIIRNFKEEITLDSISKELCVSPQYFSRLYKEHMGVNFIERLTDVRIEYAKKMIEQGGFTIKEVCYQSGYNDPNYFSKIFKKHEGVSPSMYMKNELVFDIGTMSDGAEE